MISGLKAKSLLGMIAALVLLATVVSTALADLGLQYTFVQGVDDLTKAGGINDQSGKGHNGTVINSGFAEFAAGPSGKMNAIHIDNVNTPDETDGSGVNTGTKTDNADLNIFNGPYTVMAWVNLDDQTGDHMVFGTPPPNAPGANSANTGSLHLGFRNKQVYNGWWGAGTTRDSAYDNQGNLGYVGATGEWHHVAWSFDGSQSGGLQSIYQDGLLYQAFRSKVWYGGALLDQGANPPNNAPVNLLIGRTVANNGAFSGSLSDVRVYNTALSQSDIAAIAASPP
jgi:Concanavalin A-like lectin/glucanases superfamily